MYRRLLTRHWVLWVMLVLMTWSLMLDCLAGSQIPELLPLRESYPQDVETVHAVFVGRDFTPYILSRGDRLTFHLERLTEEGWAELEPVRGFRIEMYYNWWTDASYKGRVVAFDMTRFGDVFEAGKYRISEQILIGPGLLTSDISRVDIREVPRTSFEFVIE